MDPEPIIIKEKVGGNIIQRKPKTELRKPKKSKKVEDVDPILLRKRMRQLYKAVVNYQVIFKKANLCTCMYALPFSWLIIDSLRDLYLTHPQYWFLHCFPITGII